MVGAIEEHERRGDGPHLGGLGGGAGGHTGEGREHAGHRGLPVVQLPYTPELKPVKRFFRELRRGAVEGRVYPPLEA